MRKLCCLLLVFLFTASVSTAQKKVRTRKNPNTPVWINTPSGKKLPVPAMRPMAPAPQARTFSPRPKVTMRNKRAADTGDLIKVTRRVPVDTKGKSNQRGTPTFKDLHIYYPKKENQKKNTSTQRRMASYPSITISSQADVNNFNTNYPNCDEVGTLIINGSGISNLATMTNIGRVDELIIKNTSLTSLSNLQGLSAVTDSLVLENNGSLSSIGLSNVDELGGLYIRGCSSLQTVGPFGSSLTEIANDVFLENSGVTSLSGLSGVTSIGGDLNISSTPLTTLNELTNLDHISSYLFLNGNNNMTSIVLPSLTFLRGIVLWNMPLISTLGNLTDNLTQSDFYSIGVGYMDALTDISGLNRLTSVSNIYVVGCHQLTSLNGLENLTSARYGISLYDNNLLSDITALSQITTVEYDMVEVAWNSSLSSLSGLGSITKMDALWIAGNSQLTSLNALNPGLEIYNVNGDDLQVYGNSQLTVCSVPAICNYLNSSNAVDPQIHSNGPSCGDLSEVMASCGSAPGCGLLVDITWTGDNDDEWDNPLNWSPNGVPDECSRVIIPTDMNQYPYVSSGNDISIGGLVMMSSDLDLNGGNLFVGDSVNLSGANIYAGTITMTGSVNPRIIFSHLDAYAVNIVSYRGGSYFYGNSVYGDLSISDVPSRTSVSYTFGNDVSGNFTFTNRSNDPQNYLSNGNEMADEISGDLIINNNTMASLSIGLGSDEPLSVAGDVYLNGNITSDPFYVEKITFFDSNDQSLHLNFPGSNVFEINELYLRKYYSSYLRLTKDLKVNRKLVMGNGSGAIKTESAKMLIVGDTCVLVDEDPLGGSFVDGPMKKIGNTAFTFPIGNIPSPANRGKNPDAEQAGQRGGPVVIYNKAPLSISAPTETNASFIAEYSKSNPLYNGYDTAFHDAGTGTIQTGEYWKLTRESGASNVVVSLNYNDTRLNDNFTPASLQVTGWDGSKWVNWGNGGTTGTAQRGMVSSASPLTTYGPLALAVQEVRKPIVTITPFDSMVCVGKTLMVHFTLDTSALPGNIFRVQLSDQNGSFESGTVILNSKTTSQSDSILVTIPSNLILGNQYRIRVIGSMQDLVSENAPVVIPQNLPQITVALEGPAKVCMETGVIKYYPSEKEAGVTYNYTVTGGTFTVHQDTAFVTFTSPGTASIKLTPANQCGNGAIVTKTIAVSSGIPSVAPELTNMGRSLHLSTPPGQNIIYHWYRNGSLITGADQSFYLAEDAGTYTAAFANTCGAGPLSNSYSFAAPAIAQTINYPGNADVTMAPNLKIKQSATSSSGLPVYYSLIAGPGTISNDSLAIHGVGTFIVRAAQPGSDAYSPAEAKYDTIIVSKGNQVVTFLPIGDQWYKTRRIFAEATSTAGLPVTYLIKSGNATASANRIDFTGVGNVTVEASQNGNANYHPAAPIQHTFCVGIDTLPAIKGAATACMGTYTYTTEKITGANYVWTLSGGGTMVTSNDTAFVTWNTTGTHTLKVKANSDCNATFSYEPELNITIANVLPTPVTNMTPAHGAVGQSLPLTLSWVPGENTETYDLYVWDSAASRPPTPYRKDVSALSFTIPQHAFAYNTTYKWQLVSKNPCNEATGPVQTFRLVPLPDLTVMNVLAPTTAISGQTISITWTVKNEGPGATLATQNWQDNVFLSFDSLPNMEVPPNVNPGGWNQLDLPVRPLLIGSKTNLAALQPGEQYTNTLDFKLPVNYNFPVYIFVQTNRNKSILETAYDNNKDSAVKPVVISLAPTPDLRVDSVFTPNTVFSGAEISVTYKVKNFGALTPAGAVWIDQVYISQNPLFDSASAIKVHTTAPFGRYYPSSPLAFSSVTTQLQSDSSYTSVIQAVIPNFIFGKWFIHVKTNNDHRLYEGASVANNVATNEIQVYLTPTPHLTVNSVAVPVSEASTTQPIGLNWVIKNTGSTDNFEKNQGHYYGRPEGVKPCFPKPIGSTNARQMNGQENGRFDGSVGETYDSLGPGSSYWLDRVYISSDPSGLDLNNARLLVEYKNGTKPFSGVDFYNFMFICGEYGVANGAHALLPNRSFANSAGFTVPQDLQPGTYYLYVYTNPTKTVFEYPGTAEIKRSDPIVIERPDVVAAINAPANAVAGAPVQIDYTISNNGPGSVYNHKRVDQLFISSNPVFDGSATLAGTKTFTENVLTSTPVTHALTFTLHPSESGTRYFFIKTNATYAFGETDTMNNVSAAGVIHFAPAAPVDLVVSQISTPDTVLAGVHSSLQYTIINNGTGAGVGKAVDSFFVSCSPIFSHATAFYVGKKEKDRNIAPGASVTDTFTTVLPFTFQLGDCFSNDNFNNAFFFVKTNATGVIYEGSDSTNNTTASTQKVIKNMLIDLRVDSVMSQPAATVGRPYAVSWKTKNVGEHPAIGFGSATDSVYISVDSVLNSNAVAFGGRLWNKRLRKFESEANYVNNNFINVPTGDYYVLVKTNAQVPSQIIGERNFSNNVNLLRDGMGKAQKISVVRPPLPDLVDSIISYPATASPGQPITVIHRIKNMGDGESYPNKFYVEMWLSDDPLGRTNTHPLQRKEKTVSIPAGGFVDDTITVYIPKYAIAQNYRLVVAADEPDRIVETNELNNRAMVFMNVFIPEPVDLVITSLRAVDTVLLGYGIDSVRYVMKNNSANPAAGHTSDGFYLSAADVLDSSAVLIGVKNKNINILPLASDSLVFAPVVSGVTEGTYNLFVTADLTNTIPETNETNNTAMASTPVHVTVKELRLDELESNTLSVHSRYYKLIIPDSLHGATISVKLVSADSLTKINQMFIGKGYVPDAAHFDYTYPTANYGNQDIVMAYTTAGTYYISIRCVNPVGVPQNITLKARKMPFEISNVHSSTGGNIGNVTVKIQGSLFTEGMTARLNRSGTEITSSNIYFTNTTVVYATFNLKGKPLGIYDLTLSKGDTSFALLPAGFSIVQADNGGLITGSGPNTGAGNGNEPGCDPGAASGLNSQLMTELIVPPKVFAGWPFEVHINFRNPTNYDIPAQVRTLYAEEFIKLGLTAAASAAGASTLTITIEETEGPPGVIRAGGSGTIRIYGRSDDDVPGHTWTLINLK